MEEPPSSSDDDQNDQQKFVESSTHIIQMGLKPVVYLWIFGIAAVYIGNEAETHGSAWGLLIMPGVLALLAAFIATTFGLWLGAPMIVGRFSGASRSLAALSFVLLWASTPLFFYYWLNPYSLPFRPEAFLGYAEFRGIYVAKLFLAGIVACYCGRQYDVPKYRRIQPYVVLPIVCLFVSGWLAPEKDDGALLTGLTLPLVYYVGVTFAVCVGFGLGRFSRPDWRS